MCFQERDRLVINKKNRRKNIKLPKVSESCHSWKHVWGSFALVTLSVLWSVRTLSLSNRLLWGVCERPIPHINWPLETFRFSFLSHAFSRFLFLSKRLRQSPKNHIVTTEESEYTEVTIPQFGFTCYNLVQICPLNLTQPPLEHLRMILSEVWVILRSCLFWSSVCVRVCVRRCGLRCSCWFSRTVAKEVESANMTINSRKMRNNRLWHNTGFDTHTHTHTRVALRKMVLVREGFGGCF